MSGDGQSWQEAIEREVEAPELLLCELLSAPQQVSFQFSGTESRGFEKRPGEAESRHLQRGIAGKIEIAAVQVNPQLFKITVATVNLTPAESLENTARINRDELMLRSLVSAHTILNVREGEFVSLLDPPENLRQAAAACRNIGTWPVLVGKEGEREVMLSSPIVLYDYPQIAPESAGDFFDGMEIDEMLTLRLLTLTEEEKCELREGDERARQILERTETLPAEQLMKLHGAMRGLKQAQGEDKGGKQ
jgi:hypothetical protein